MMNSFQQYLEIVQNDRFYVSNESLDLELKKQLISLGLVGSLLFVGYPLYKNFKNNKIESMVKNPEEYKTFLEKTYRWKKNPPELKEIIDEKIKKIKAVNSLPEETKDEKVLKTEALEKIKKEISDEFKDKHSHYLRRMNRLRRKN